jgi:hypothetical protein
VLNVSSDAGETWIHRQLSRAVDNIVIGGQQNCQVDTDSGGAVYVFWNGFTTKGQLAIFYIRSFDGGKSFERTAHVLTTVEPTADPFDGAAGAATGVTPSISIANGAPTGNDAPNTIAVTYAEGPTPTDEDPGPFEKAQVWLGQIDGRAPVDWHGPFTASPGTDRPMFPAVALSPHGSDLYLTYDAFLQPWQSEVPTPPALPRLARRLHALGRSDGPRLALVHRARSWPDR